MSGSSPAPPSEIARATRIVIVEDEPLVVINLEGDLVDAGFEVVGVAARLDRALKLINEERFDIAILDANLAGASAAPVAKALSDRGIPSLVLTGYAREQLPPEFARSLYVQKPYVAEALIRELTGLASRSKS